MAVMQQVTQEQIHKIRMDELTKLHADALKVAADKSTAELKAVQDQLKAAQDELAAAAGKNAAELKTAQDQLKAAQDELAAARKELVVANLALESEDRDLKAAQQEIQSLLRQLENKNKKR